MVTSAVVLTPVESAELKTRTVFIDAVLRYKKRLFEAVF